MNHPSQTQQAEEEGEEEDTFTDKSIAKGKADPTLYGRRLTSAPKIWVPGATVQQQQGRCSAEKGHAPVSSEVSGAGATNAGSESAVPCEVRAFVRDFRSRLRSFLGSTYADEIHAGTVCIIDRT